MKKVLIVEDDPVFLGFIKESLKAYQDKFQVITAENGKVAKEIIASEEISLLLTDIMMPEVDGLALLAYLNDRNYSIPCFVMSAFGTPEIKKLIPKDVLQFFNKPFPVDKLGFILLKALEEGVPSGTLSGISVASFLVLVEMEKKTCLFEVELPDGSKGLCYFNKGVLFNASYSGMRGEDAVLALLQKEKARFVLKNLPDQKLARLVFKDLSTLIQESRRQEAEEEEDLEKTIEVVYDDTDFGRDDKKGNDGKSERRLDLAGSYYDEKADFGGRMTVINMSLSHLIFQPAEPRELVPGTVLKLDFTLDDKHRSQVTKEVTIEDCNNGYIRCRFFRTYHYDRLGPYLHFNYLDKQTI
jgi:CheY-like chemotaxis protein